MRLTAKRALLPDLVFLSNGRDGSVLFDVGPVLDGVGIHLTEWRPRIVTSGRAGKRQSTLIEGVFQAG